MFCLGDFSNLCVPKMAPAAGVFFHAPRQNPENPYTPMVVYMYAVNHNPAPSARGEYVSHI